MSSGYRQVTTTTTNSPLPTFANTAMSHIITGHPLALHWSDISSASICANYTTAVTINKKTNYNFIHATANLRCNDFSYRP